MAKRASTSFVPSDQHKKAILHDALWYELVFTFGVPAHDPLDYCQWEAVNFNRMAHARVLYTFLETPLARRRDDDVLAEDYGFPAQAINLPDDDRRRLNKDLFHLTYARLRHIADTKPWPDTILANLLESCIAFMEHVKSRPKLFDTDAQCTNWAMLLDRLKSGRELHIRGAVGPDHHSYSFTLGAPLPDGKPMLTRLFV